MAKSNEDLMDGTAKKKKKKVIGRPTSKDNEDVKKKILVAAKKAGGATNVSLSQILKIPTGRTQALCRPMVAGGFLKMKKDKETGRVTYVAS